METKAEFATDLLYFTRKKCKSNSLEKSINECFEIAVRAKPKVTPLLLYEDRIKIKDQKKDIQLSNVKSVSEFKEPMILVLCSDHKRGKKCLLSTLKFKGINGYVNVLWKIKNIVRAEESRRKFGAQSDVTSRTDSRQMKQNQQEGGIAMTDHFPLPGEKFSMPREDGKSQKLSKSAADAIQERTRRPNFRSAPLIEQNALNQPVSPSQINEDSDYYSSFNSAEDYCGIFNERQYESDQAERRRGIGNEKTLRDSRGNTVLILRPCSILFQGNRY
ncbi:unnamed protein product [Rodentolepis nana]|uniref:DUF5734 domain-containing protein n=1 Tax=Rodentolepis nana TaxID=102285 RepID=A0A0R3TTS1_RODNA|nr:unnamed protein product [Rodentolepis nana]